MAHGIKTYRDGDDNLHILKTNRKMRRHEKLQSRGQVLITVKSPNTDPKVGATVVLAVGEWNRDLRSADLTIERYAQGATPGVTSPLETVQALAVDPDGSLEYLLPSGSQTGLLRPIVVAKDTIGRGRTVTAIGATVTILPSTQPRLLTDPVIAGTTDPSGSLTISSYGTGENVTIPGGLSWIWQSDDADISGTSGATSYAKSTPDGSHTIKLRVWITGMEATTSRQSAGIAITAPVGLFPGFAPRARWGVTELRDNPNVSGQRNMLFGTSFPGSPGALDTHEDGGFTYYTHVVVQNGETDLLNPPTPNFNTQTKVPASGNGIIPKTGTWAAGTVIGHYLWAQHSSGPYYLVTDPTDTITISGLGAVPYGTVQIEGPVGVSLSPPSYDTDPKITPAGPVAPSTTLTLNRATVVGNPTPTETVAWRKNGTTISGETADTYVTRAGDDTATITARQSATNSQGGPVLSNVSNGVLVQATPPDPPDLPEVPAAVLTAAMAKPLAEFEATNTGTQNTAATGGYQLVEAYNSFQGKTNSDAAVLAQLRHNLEGGSDPSFYGGYGIQHEFQWAAAAALARNTPRLWNALSSSGANSEQAKITLQMRAALVCSCAMTGPGNKALNFRGDKDWNTKGNPNFRLSRPATLLACRFFFGSAAACSSYLATYSRADMRAAIVAAGLDNAAVAINNRGSYSDTEVENIVDSWSWSASDASGSPYTWATLDRLLAFVVNDMFNQPCMSGVGGTAGNGWIGPGISGRAKIQNNASGLPNKGATGMAQEYNSGDADGKRSSSKYVEDGFKVSMGILLLAMCEGSLNPNNSDWAQALTRAQIGYVDHVYKTTNTYLSYSKGGADLTWNYDNQGTSWGLTYMHRLWPDIIKPWVDAQ